MKRGIFAILALVILAEGTMFFLSNLSLSYAQEAFSDLDSSHWAYEYVMPLVSQGVIKGYDDGTYKPSKTISRAEFLKLMVCATIGETEASKITVDIDKLKTTNVDEDIVAKYSGDPDIIITYEGKPAKETERETLIALGIDVDDVYQGEEVLTEYSYSTEWFAPYTYWAELNNLSSNTYSDVEWKQPISRKEMAKILYNFSNYKGLFDSNSSISNDDTLDEEELDKISAKSGDVKLSREDLDKMIEILIQMGNKKLKVGSSTEKDIQKAIESLPQKSHEEYNKLLDATFNKEDSNVNVEDYKIEKGIKFVDLYALDSNSVFEIENISNIGLIKGYEDNTFKPDNNMTRAEVSAVISRFMKLVSKDGE